MPRAPLLPIALALALLPFAPAASQMLFPEYSPRLGTQTPEDPEEELNAADIMAIQRRLNELGFQAGRVDGTLGRRSREAIASFQAENGLRPDGRASPGLMVRLQTARSKAPGGGDPAPAPGQVAQWRRDMAGKPVFGTGSGRIGRIEGLAVGADQRVSAAVIMVEDARGQPRTRIQVPWHWVEGQVNADTVILPWNAAEVDWLISTQEVRRPTGEGLSGWKTSWLDGAQAVLEDGLWIGTVEGFLFGPLGQVEAVVVRRPDGQRHPVPRPSISVDEDARLLTVHLSAAEVASLTPMPEDGEPVQQLVSER